MREMEIDRKRERNKRERNKRDRNIEKKETSQLKAEYLYCEVERDER